MSLYGVAYESLKFCKQTIGHGKVPMFFWGPQGAGQGLKTEKVASQKSEACIQP
jgi:hypothetical protein